MNLNITTNLAEVRSRLSGLEKQVNFAASKALNDTALIDWQDASRQRDDYEFNRMIYVAMPRAAKHMAIVK